MTSSRINSFTDLIVWETSHKLAIEIFKLAQNSYRNNLNMEIWKQALRSAFSTPANIAEGFSSHKGKSYVSHLEIARGSSEETRYWLIVLKETGNIPESKLRFLSEKYVEVNKMLSKMIASLNSKTTNP